ncbi:MAG TPA: hypothetical protein VLA46_04065 [Saprospiraceae bacterium]|nr:hypothetical protein [Saprospiraceae bacterium]
MIRRFIPLILILCPIVSYGQFGVNVKYLFGQSEILDSVNISQDGIQASLEYSFRLKQNRIEFHPGLGYRFTFKEDSYDGYFTAFDFDINTAVYPFDFEGDCDCPTWSKDGTLIKKGFFLELSPGISYQTLHRDKFISLGDPQPEPIQSSAFLFKFSAAAGLDIGITEQFTLTPMFSYTLLTGNEWEGLLRSGSSGNLDDYAYLGAGLRLAYKPDPKRRRRF